MHTHTRVIPRNNDASSPLIFLFLIEYFSLCRHTAASSVQSVLGACVEQQSQDGLLQTWPIAASRPQLLPPPAWPSRCTISCWLSTQVHPDKLPIESFREQVLLAKRMFGSCRLHRRTSRSCRPGCRDVD